MMIANCIVALVAISIQFPSVVPNEIVDLDENRTNKSIVEHGLMISVDDIELRGPEDYGRWGNRLFDDGQFRDFRPVNNYMYGGPGRQDRGRDRPYRENYDWQSGPFFRGGNGGYRQGGGREQGRGDGYYYDRDNDPRRFAPRYGIGRDARLDLSRGNFDGPRRISSYMYGPPMMSNNGPPMMSNNGPPMMSYNGPPRNTYGAPPMMSNNGPPMMSYNGPPRNNYGAPYRPQINNYASEMGNFGATRYVVGPRRPQGHDPVPEDVDVGAQGRQPDRLPGDIFTDSNGREMIIDLQGQPVLVHHYILESTPIDGSEHVDRPGKPDVHYARGYEYVRLNGQHVIVDRDGQHVAVNRFDVRPKRSFALGGQIGNDQLGAFAHISGTYYDGKDREQELIDEANQVPVTNPCHESEKRSRFGLAGFKLPIGSVEKCRKHCPKSYALSECQPLSNGVQECFCALDPRNPYWVHYKLAFQGARTRAQAEQQQQRDSAIPRAGHDGREPRHYDDDA